MFFLRMMKDDGEETTNSEFQHLTVPPKINVALQIDTQIAMLESRDSFYKTHHFWDTVSIR